MLLIQINGFTLDHLLAQWKDSTSISMPDMFPAEKKKYDEKQHKKAAAEAATVEAEQIAKASQEASTVDTSQSKPRKRKSKSSPEDVVPPESSGQ